MKIKIPTSEQIIKVNQYVCKENNQSHHLLDIGKIESALSTTFYPGSEPYLNGGIARLAGAAMEIFSIFKKFLATQTVR